MAGGCGGWQDTRSHGTGHKPPSLPTPPVSAAWDAINDWRQGWFDIVLPQARIQRNPDSFPVGCLKTDAPVRALLAAERARGGTQRGTKLHAYGAAWP